MVAILGANSVSGGYEVSNSLRFNDGDNPLLTRTHSDTNHRTFTFSCWVKRSALGTGNQRLFSTDDEASDDFRIRFTSADILHVSDNQSGTAYEFDTNRKFRDISAWYNIVVAWDTTQGTNTNRVKIYVNGVQETSFSTASYPTQNHDTLVNQNTSHEVGGSIYDSDGTGARQSFDGYMSEVHFVDGSQLAPTSFGEFDDNGVWIPKKYSGSYGTNGFFLEFKQTGTSQNSSGIGADTSGNDNHFAVTNLASTDITEDTCTNNFATFNSIIPVHSSMTLKEGNLQGLTANAYGNNVSNSWFSTIGVDQGKWYAEFKLIQNSSSEGGLVGVAYDLSKQQQGSSSSAYNFAQSIDEGWAYNMNGSWYNNGANAGFSTYTTNDIIGVALDLDNNKIYWSKNGTYQNSGDPANNTNGISIDANEVYFFAISDTTLSNTFTYQANFGNPPFTISSGNNDGKYGNFEYAPPSGYYALCTKRLAEFG